MPQYPENILTGISRTSFRKTVIVIAPVGDPDKLLPFLTVDDAECSGRFTDNGRRAAFITWRAILRAEKGNVPVFYDPAGAPYPADGSFFMGVSHTKDTVALIMSDTRCAIDIENRSRDFSRASRRFISPQERMLGNADNPGFEGFIWCAKETLYKYSGRTGLDLLRDIRITSFDPSDGLITGIVATNSEDSSPSYALNILEDETLIGTWIAG